MVDSFTNLSTGDRPSHILTITPFYPCRLDDARGCFVSEPLPFVEKLGFASSVIAVRSFYEGPVEENSNAPPATWVRYFPLPSHFGLPTAGFFLFANLLSPIRRLVQRERVDLIHAHSALPCGHAAALLGRELKIPFIVSVHGLDAYSTNQVRGYSGKLAKRISQWVYRRACKVVCVSEKVRASVLQDVQADTSVIYNGVNPEVFAPGADGGKTVLSVGNLIAIKGHECLLRAIATVQHKHQDLTCDIIGDGSEQMRLTNLSSELGISGHVRFLGRRSRNEVAEAMQHCTIFALPSRYEALGCVYLEAMATGKPIIGCIGQGIEEVIRNGIDGVLVPPDDQDALAVSLAALLDDDSLRRGIGEAARNTILQGYTLAKQAQKLGQLYQECIG
ncbi:MAG TPA: glycosyltransferase [Terriglobales bacterium]